MATVESAVARVPDELWAKILRNIKFPIFQYPPCSSHTCQSPDSAIKDLLKISRTNTVLHDHAQRIIWRYLGITQLHNIPKVLNVISNRLLRDTTTTLGALIRHLDLPIGTPWHYAQPLLQNAPNLRQIHCDKFVKYNTIVRLPPTLFPSLCHLTDLAVSTTLRGSRFTQADISRISGACPELRKLSIARLGLPIASCIPGDLTFSFPKLTTLSLGIDRPDMPATTEDRQLFSDLMEKILSDTKLETLRELFILEDIGDISPLLVVCGSHLRFLSVFMHCTWATLCPTVDTVVVAAEHMHTSFPKDHFALRHLYIRSPPQRLSTINPVLHKQDIQDFVQTILLSNIPPLRSLTFCGGYWTAADAPVSSLNALLSRDIKLTVPDHRYATDDEGYSLTAY